MSESLIAKAQVDIAAPLARVWAALVTPAMIREYMFGTNVVSEWKVGAPIVWRGEWQGKPYEDKGQILQLEPEERLQYSHFSPLSGQPDVPENYHTVTVELTPSGTGTRVTLTQDKNASDEEREHAEQNWSMMLDSLKQFVEK
jgi:uncharacterized protein YndB with AHSA1/START domain